MEIEITPGVIWNNNITIQSEEAISWFRSNVYEKMAHSKSWSETYIQPEYDNFQRPRRWVFDFDSFKVIVEREYIFSDSPSWAAKGDNVEFSKK